MSTRFAHSHMTRPIFETWPSSLREKIRQWPRAELNNILQLDADKSKIKIKPELSSAFSGLRGILMAFKVAIE